MTVLVTGATGYVGTHVIARLLTTGGSVRASVRSLDREPAVRTALTRAGVDDSALEVVAADLLSDEGWSSAADGCEGIFHTASPMTRSQDPDAFVVPAREGTLRALRAARERGVRRVVLTSSFAAVGYSPKAEREYDEDDWTDPETPDLPAYPLSKAVAERAAWDFVGSNGGPELVVLNPTFIAGPTLTLEVRSSLMFFKALLEGTLPALPRQRFGVADVRDVADAHVAAMSAADAAGKRFLLLADGPTITYRDLAQLLRDRLGPRGEKVTLTEAPGEEPGPLVIHNERAKDTLGFRPRPAEETIVETATSLYDLGLVS